VVEPTPINDETPRRKQRFQFGLRGLLLLTALCAAIAALAGSLRAPTAFRVIVALYFMSLAAYAVLRTPHLYRRVRYHSERLTRIRQKRKELETLVAEAKARREQGKDAQGTGAPQRPPD
jgi:hypothetical protein